eukprot:15815787-Heterocapsa_arctica.AAC.1
MEKVQPYGLTGVELRKAARGAELGNQHYSSFRNLFLSQTGACSIAAQLITEAFGPTTGGKVAAPPAQTGVTHSSPLAHTCPADSLLLRHVFTLALGIGH